MTSYRIQEAEISIPETWMDQSINIFKIPASQNAGEASFVISRDATKGDDSFPDYVAKQIAMAEKKLPGFKLLQREDFDLRGHAASSILYQWNNNGLALILCQAFIEENPVIILTLTTLSKDAKNYAAAWREVVRGYRPIAKESQ